MAGCCKFSEAVLLCSGPQCVDKLHFWSAVQDDLGWTQAHVVGHSMGAMIECKFASHYPEHVLSLTLLSMTGGGWQIIPTSGKAVRNALRAVTNKSDEGRARADVKFHYSTSLRRMNVSGVLRGKCEG